MNTLFTTRLAALVRRRILTGSEADRFTKLEGLMQSPTDGTDDALMVRFHDSNDAYLPLLERVLRGLVRIGEPLAREKLDLFLEERGSQGPAVFLTPWEMTLTYLDDELGKLESISAFYS
jgi:hypothetical protein